MREFFMFLVGNMGKIGQLNEATFYDEEFAQVKFINDGKTYVVSLRREKTMEEENDGN